MRRLAIAALVACSPVAPPVSPAPPIANVAPAPPPPTAPQPLTFRVTRATIVDDIRATGTLAPTATTDVTSGAGPIGAVYVDVGDAVTKSQQLATVGKTSVVAPIDGVVLVRNVEAGMATTGNAVLFTIAASLDRMLLVAPIEEAAFTRVAVGMPVVFAVPAYPGVVFTGQVTRLAAAISAGRLPVTISVANADHRLRPGMTADVAIRVARRNDVLVVPLAAIESKTVRVVRGGTPTRVAISVGIDDGTLAEVTAGLAEGDAVVVDR